MATLAVSEAGAGQVGDPFEGRLTSCCHSDVGMAREQNEDNFGLSNPEETNQNGWLFIVADGMGGAAAGRTASTLAVETSKSAYRDYLSKNARATPFDGLRHAIESANLSIFQRAREDASTRGMGTTIVALAVHGDKAYTAHVGDSRIYRFRDGRLERMMRDHTRVQTLSDQGIITPAEANSHPESHVINRNLGGRDGVDVDTPEDGPFDLLEGDTYLLCSDGLHGLVDDEAIRQILSAGPPELATPALIKLANARGGYDNITVSIITAGRWPEGWSDADAASVDRLVDRLSIEEASDTALFEAQDPDALGPADFETQQLKALQIDGPESRVMPVVMMPTEEESRNKLKRTVATTVTPEMLQAAAAAHAARSASSKAQGAVTEATPSVPVQSSSGSGFPWLLLIGLGVMLLLLLVVAVVAFMLLSQ